MRKQNNLKPLAVLTLAVLMGSGCRDSDSDDSTPPVEEEASTETEKPMDPTDPEEKNLILEIDVTKPGVNNYEPQVFQNLPQGLTAGQEYTLSYRAKASEEKMLVVQANLGEDNGYKGYPSDNLVTVTTEWQVFTKTFVADETDESIQLQINLGANGAYQIWFDDLTLMSTQENALELITNGGIISEEDWQYATNGGEGEATVSVVTE